MFHNYSSCKNNNLKSTTRKKVNFQFFSFFLLSGGGGGGGDCSAYKKLLKYFFNRLSASELEFGILFMFKQNHFKNITCQSFWHIYSALSSFSGKAICTHPRPFCIAGVVHENPRIGSDGESEEISGTSDEKDDVISPVRMRNRQRRLSEVRGITHLG